MTHPTINSILIFILFCWFIGFIIRPSYRARKAQNDKIDNVNTEKNDEKKGAPNVFEWVEGGFYYYKGYDQNNMVMIKIEKLEEKRVFARWATMINNQYEIGETLYDLSKSDIYCDINLNKNEEYRKK